MAWGIQPFKGIRIIDDYSEIIHPSQEEKTLARGMESIEMYNLSFFEEFLRKEPKKK